MGRGCNMRGFRHGRRLAGNICSQSNDETEAETLSSNHVVQESENGPSTALDQVVHNGEGIIER